LLKKQQIIFEAREAGCSVYKKEFLLKFAKGRRPVDVLAFRSKEKIETVPFGKKPRHEPLKSLQAL